MENCVKSRWLSVSRPVVVHAELQRTQFLNISQLHVKLNTGTEVSTEH